MRSRLTLLTFALALAACSDPAAIEPTMPLLANDDPQVLQLDAAPMAWHRAGRRAELVEAVETWNDNIAQFGVLAAVSPPVESRISAMANTTMHDALNAVQRRFEPYAYDGHVDRPVSVEAAIATGVHDVLAAAGQGLPTPAPLEFINRAYADYMAALEQCDEVTRGVQLGHDAAAAMLALRAGDGSTGPPVAIFTSTGEPGKFRSTVGPATALTGPQAIANWGQVKPFALSSSAQYRAPPMYGAATVAAAVLTPLYLADYTEVKRLGGVVSERTQDQTDMALYWIEHPVQTWNRIARILAGDRHLNAWQLARLVSQVALTQADALISAFDANYHYNFWRPVTAIRLGNLDPTTPGDPSWQVSTISVPAVGATPPFPEHIAAASVLAEAAAQAILANLHGTTRFTMESTTLPGKPRSFRSVSEAARESAEARIYGGAFFRQSLLDGGQQGRSVGRYVTSHTLQRVPGRD